MDAEIDNLLAGLSDNEETNASSNAPSSVSSSSVVAIHAPTFEPSEYSNIETQIGAQFKVLQELFEPRASILNNSGLTVQQYLDLVRILGNDPVDTNRIDTLLTQALGRERALIFRIHLSENPAPVVATDVYDRITRTVENITQLLSRQKSLLHQWETEVTQRMPNLAVLVSVPICAKLLAKLGGLRQLGRTPPSNLVNPRTSVLADDPLLREVPDLQKRAALRIVASKLVLAARLDASSPGGQTDKPSAPLPTTLNWKRSIHKRIDQLLAPPPSLQHRSLPKPVDKRSARRGGQKLRKRKQRLAQKMGKPETIRFG